MYKAASANHANEADRPINKNTHQYLGQGHGRQPNQANRPNQQSTYKSLGQGQADKPAKTTGRGHIARINHLDTSMPAGRPGRVGRVNQ